MDFQEYNCPVCGQHFSSDILKERAQVANLLMASVDGEVDPSNIPMLKTAIVPCGKCGNIMFFNGNPD